MSPFHWSSGNWNRDMSEIFETGFPHNTYHSSWVGSTPPQAHAVGTDYDCSDPLHYCNGSSYSCCTNSGSSYCTHPHLLSTGWNILWDCGSGSPHGPHGGTRKEAHSHCGNGDIDDDDLAGGNSLFGNDSGHYRVAAGDILPQSRWGILGEKFGSRGSQTRSRKTGSSPHFGETNWQEHH